MARLYISGDEAKITLKEHYRVDVEFYNGVKFEDLEPRRLFPISGLKIHNPSGQ